MNSLRPLFGSLLLICVSLNVPLATAKDNSTLTASDRQEARREFCRQNPQKCEDLVKQAQERREDIRDYCAKNPAECVALKGPGSNCAYLSLLPLGEGAPKGRMRDSQSVGDS